ncbi:MAG: transporter substrate-binding domain-containing protein [Hyphomicrobiaceae bacterium]|jgi:polar amino acid transport system substrate-binding protein|nr:transporter substrate-binding domain-containing protein [Hyphomicrobiaceae bacterium]MDX2449495.1 transporter substrate-binding domain-containing protein [Hyphomicrobiaceae bacterium]
MMKRILCLSVLAALTLTSNAFAADTCTKIVSTGHPQYPAIAFKEGDSIKGAAPALVKAIAKNLNIPLESKYMGNWSEAQAAARDGKADMIVGVYFNDDRAKYLDYVKPAFVFDPVVAFVAKDKKFPYKGKKDLIGKKGATNKGESYGTKFDAFMKDKLTVTRTDGLEDAFKDLVAGKVDYVLAGYYPGDAKLSKMGIDDKVEALEPALLSAEMFVAFSKKSPCASMASKFGQGITELTTDGSFNKMLTGSIAEWDADQD